MNIQFFNINLLIPDNSKLDFIHTCYNNALLQLIIQPTQMSTNSYSCMDHIWYNESVKKFLRIFGPSITNYLPRFTFLPSTSNIANPINKLKLKRN